MIQYGIGTQLIMPCMYAKKKSPHLLRKKRETRPPKNLASRHFPERNGGTVCLAQSFTFSMTMKSNVIYGSAAIKGRGRYTIDIMNNVDSMVFSDVREGSTCISISPLSLSCCQMTREFYVNGYEQEGKANSGKELNREKNQLLLFIISH